MTSIVRVDFTSRYCFQIISDIRANADLHAPFQVATENVPDSETNFPLSHSCRVAFFCLLKTAQGMFAATFRTHKLKPANPQDDYPRYGRLFNMCKTRQEWKRLIS
jgi:hypothetical protein